MKYKISQLTGAPSAPLLTDLFEIARVASPFDSFKLSFEQLISAWSTGFSVSGDEVTNDAITGLVGGQTLTGGTAASDVLTLSSTSNGTKGKIVLGSSTYNEANNKIGINVSNLTALLAQLQVETSAAYAESIRISGASFYSGGPSNDDGVSFLLGYNTGGNRQLWLADSAALAVNSSNACLAINLGGTSTPAIQSNSTNGTALNLALQPAGGNLGIGTAAPVASALVDVSSTTKGFLFPRMTTTQKNAISTPVAGLCVYDITLNKLCVYTTAWETITSL